MSTPPITANSTVTSSRDIARYHEDRTLYILHRYGYLTSMQVGAIVYRNYDQYDRLARRTLKRLVDQGYVLCKEGGIGHPNHYALSKSGAQRVWDAWECRAVSGKDLMRSSSTHRDAANWAAIGLVYSGFMIYTEREIQTGQAPFKRMANKIPDAIGYDEEGYTYWVEVEACRRGGRDMEQLADWLVYHAFPLGVDHLVALDPPADTLGLERVRFVIANNKANTFAGRLRTALTKRLQDYSVEDWALNRIEFQMGTAINAPVRNGFSEN